jgi:MoxR-like ATPase
MEAELKKHEYFVENRAPIKIRKLGEEMPVTKSGTVWSAWELYETALQTTGVDRILVYGPPGVGKTHTACEYFQKHKIDYEQVTATEGDMVSEYRGMWVPHGDHFEWFHGLLVRAWTANGGKGMPVIINEVDKFPMECMAILHGILDNPNIASLSLPNGARVKPGPNFRFIGTMNGVPGDLSEALQSRFQVKINIEAPHQSAIDLLDEDVRPIAADLILHKDPLKRVNFRQFLTFKEIRAQVGDDLAAALVFGREAYIDTLGAIKIASKKR